MIIAQYTDDKVMIKTRLSTADGARLLGVSKALLKKWRYEGGGPPYSKVNGRVHYERRELIKFVKINNRTPGNRVLRIPE